jgi:hypothetical protein
MRVLRIARLRPLVALTVAFVATGAACSSGNKPVTSSFDGGAVKDGGKDTNISLGMDSSMLTNPDANHGMDACASTTAKADVLPLDMFIVLDRSGSLADNNAWNEEVQALTDFLDDVNSAGIGVALQYMPLAQLCDVSAYSVPAAPLSILPGGSGALITSLSNTRPFGGTPTTIALEGAIEFAKARQISNPNREIVLVLSTDGLPDSSCSIVPDGGGLTNSTANVVTVLSAAAALPTPIKTFVIGLGNEPTLNQFATAGGTGQAILVGSSDAGTATDIEAPLLSALSSIRNQALPCSYTIPQANEGGIINYGNVNVSFTPAGQASQQFYGVSDAAACQTTNMDWYYDTTMTHVVLCPNSCTAVKAVSKGAVNIDYGCTTLPPPIAK